jgi:hypothetical protein
MNCKQIREEIDAAPRYDLRGAIRSHLNGCPDCRRYSDETASLLGLLGAQPRVEAPADFEFRLRARMARAEAALESDRQSFLRKIFSEKWPASFSWGQLAAAAATLALALTFSTFYVKRDDQAAGSITAGDSGSPVRAVAPQSNVAAEGVEAAPVKFISRGPRVRPAPYPFENQAEDQPEIRENEASPIDIAGDGSIRLYNPETKRLLNDRSRFYGAETVSISLPKPASAALTF